MKNQMVKENIYQKIMIARLKFLESNPTKSGYNKFQNFKYFELVDIVPTATKICCELGLYTHINIDEGLAKMIVLNTENPNEKVEYSLTAPAVKDDKFNSMLQDTGRCETYLRRYLYLLFLDITENDIVDAEDQNKNQFKTASQYKQRNSHKPKPSARVKAERIIKSMQNQHKDMNVVNAKLELVNLQNKGVYTMEECPAIAKELEVLLNG